MFFKGRPFARRVFVSLPCTVLVLVPLAAESTEEVPLADLDWMAGVWGSDHDSHTAEEVWLRPAGGLMLGLHRDVFAPTRSFFEYLRIEETDSGLVYYASPRGGATTAFRCVQNEASRVVFENPEHDFPQRILYWLGEDGALHARIEGNENGEDKAMGWRWTRLAEAPPLP